MNGSYLLRAGVWAACIFCSWIGLGDFVLRKLQGRSWSWPVSGLVGIAVSMFAGGILNLLQVVNRWTILCLVGFGVVCFLFAAVRGVSGWTAFWRSLRSCPWICMVSFGVLVVLLGLLTFNSLRYLEFSLFDDVWAYLTFPVKMLSLGALPADPFSERRVQSALGGGYFLQCVGLVFGGIRSIHFTDLGAGHILFCAVVFCTARLHKNSLPVSTFMALLCIFVQIFHTNLTYVLLPAALFVAVYLVERDDGIAPSVKSVLLGLLAGTAILLKTVYLPSMVLIVLGIYGYRAIADSAWRGNLRYLAISATVCVGEMLPWMVDMRRKEGTWLYPLLGKGYEIARYGHVPYQAPLEAAGVRLCVLLFASFLGLAVLVWRETRGLERAELTVIFAVAGGISVIPMFLSVGHGPLIRYTTPLLMPCLLIALAATLPGLRWRVADVKASSLFIFILLCFEANQGRLTNNWRIFEIVPNRDESAMEPLHTVAQLRAEQQRELRSQQAIPVGWDVLAANVPLIYVDHRRNNYYVADFPGMASLPPGMPIDRSAADLRDYLLQHAVEYVVYSRTNAELVANSRDNFAGRGRNAWLAMQLSVSCDVQARMAELAAEYPVVYDDGDLRVVHIR